MWRIASIVSALMMAMAMTSCHHSADKEKSDISGIVPFVDDSGEFAAMEARYTSWPDPDTLVIYIDNQQYKVASDGKTYGPDGKLAFSIGNEGRIETLYFAQKGTSVFLFYTDTTNDGSASFAKRIDLSTRKALWSSDVTGIAMGRPVIKGQFAYIASFGFVGKLKLKNGEYDWKYSSLNNGGRFEKFQEIIFANSREVMFLAPHPFTTECDTVVVSDLTGEIIRMN